MRCSLTRQSCMPKMTTPILRSSSTGFRGWTRSHAPDVQMKRTLQTCHLENWNEWIRNNNTTYRLMSFGSHSTVNWRHISSLSLTPALWHLSTAPCRGGHTTDFTWQLTREQHRIQRSGSKHMLNLCFRQDLILAKRTVAHLQKSQTQFVYGCWLGSDSHTDEHVVGSKAAVFGTRTVRRLTEDRSWSTEAVADMEWTPWENRDNDEGQASKRQLLERGMNPSGTHCCQLPPSAIPGTATEICCAESEN